MLRIAFLLLLMLLGGCGGTQGNKINGLSFVASKQHTVQEQVDALKGVHATYASIMPYGFIRDIGSPHILFDTERQWLGETRAGAKQCIDMLHDNKLRVMLKPQLWISRGAFTGFLKMENEEDWQVLESSYEDFLLHFAGLAEECKVEILCIGTELKEFVRHRPEFWQALIKKVQKVYKGKITYAANWDEYPHIPFWDSLDYIGIDAYFPLSGETTPSVETLRIAWQPWKAEIEAFSAAKGKAILFTEFGYRSVDYTARKPWLAERGEEKVNLLGQQHALEAIFREFWTEDWFAGGFVWKWFPDHHTAGGENDNRFTPQNKPAQKLIGEYFSSY